MRAKFTATLAGATLIVVLWASVAAAHVTVSPSALPQGTADAILTFRVPNESMTANVTGLRIQFPIQHPIIVLSPEAGSGWKVAVQTARLAKPVTTDDGTFSSTVSEIDWSGGTIPVGQFAEFNVLAQGIPSGTNRLVFKAIQLYGDGSTVAWIQVPDRAAPNPSHPAPILALTPSAKGDIAGPTVSSVATSSGPVTVAASSNDHGLVVLALVVAAFAMVLAVLGVWLGRPRLLAETPADGEDGPGSSTG